MKKVHVIIKGVVQGVSFRAWTVRQAKVQGLVGWVKNRSDGTLELVLEGKKEKLESFIKLCDDGPVCADVSTVDTAWSDSSGKFTDFHIRY